MGSEMCIRDSDTVMERRRAFAWDERGEVIRERFITPFSTATVAWVDGHPAAFLSDDPWGERLRGDVVFLDASREAQEIDLELRREFCTDALTEDSDLFSVPGPLRWGLDSAIFERHGDYACLRAARDEGTNPWNGWVHESELTVLARTGWSQRVHLVPAVSQTESFVVGRLLSMFITEHCVAHDNDLAGSASLQFSHAAAARWEDSTFSDSFEQCASAQMTDFGVPAELDGAQMSLTVVPTPVSLQPATCTFQDIRTQGRNASAE